MCVTVVDPALGILEIEEMPTIVGVDRIGTKDLPKEVG